MQWRISGSGNYLPLTRVMRRSTPDLVSSNLRLIRPKNDFQRKIYFDYNLIITNYRHFTIIISIHNSINSYCLIQGRCRSPVIWIRLIFPGPATRRSWNMPATVAAVPVGEKSHPPKPQGGGKAPWWRSTKKTSRSSGVFAVSGVYTKSGNMLTGRGLTLTHFVKPNRPTVIARIFRSS